MPDQVVSDGDIIYLLSSANRRVYRWSIATGSYLNPYVVGINQGFSALAPDARWRTRAASSACTSATAPARSGTSTRAHRTARRRRSPTRRWASRGLAAVGNYLLAQDYSGAWATHYIFNAAGVDHATSGLELLLARLRLGSGDLARVLLPRRHAVPNDLHYEVIDQATGQITAAGETPYHGDYGIEPPIRVSPDGQYVLLGTGDIYNQSGLTWAGSLGAHDHRCALDCQRLAGHADDVRQPDDAAPPGRPTSPSSSS